MAPSPTRRRPLSRALAASILALTLGAGLLTPVLTPSPASAATGVAGEVFALTNAERTRAGLRPLVTNAALDAAAAEWARRLAATCTFAHSTAQWRSSRVAAAGWIATGENIAAGHPDAGSVVTAWMASPGHRANILDSRYKGLGVGFASGTCYRTYWVQIFGIGSPVKELPGGAGDLTGDRKVDIVARATSGELMIYPNNGTSGFSYPMSAAPTWGSGPFITVGDFSGDNRPDLARVETDGRLMLYRGDGRGGLMSPLRIGIGWSGFRQVIGGIDFNGDRKTDVIARTSRGTLILYTGNGSGGWLTGRGVQIGSGWGAFDSISHAGDFNGDTRGDIIARRISDGSLWMYPTTGRGTWGTRVQIGSRWNGFTSVVGVGDISGDGAADVVARASDGSLYLYPGTGRGKFLPRQRIGGGWDTMSQIG